jgi:hypothetical protein
MAIARRFTARATPSVGFSLLAEGDSPRRIGVESVGLAENSVGKVLLAR